MSVWYRIQNGQQVGPLADEAIREQCRNGQLKRTDHVWKEGDPSWMPVGESELAALFPPAPPAPAPGPTPPPPPPHLLTPPPYAPAGFVPMPASDSYAGKMRMLWLWMTITLGVGLLLCAIGGFVPLVLIAGVPVIIASTVLSSILLYHLWSLIQDGTARTTPGKAVGFCFIPIFGFYWYFVAYYGLAKDMNFYVVQRGIPAKPMNEQLVLVGVILLVASLIPFIGILASLGGSVVFAVFMRSFVELAIIIQAYKRTAASR